MNNKPTLDENPVDESIYRTRIKKWFPCNILELRQAYLQLNHELNSCYVLLIYTLWEHEGELYPDINMLKKLWGFRADKAKKVKKSLAPFFNEIDGKWRHDGLYREFHHAVDKSIKSKKAADGRWKMEREKHANADDNSMQTHCQYITEHDMTHTYTDNELERLIEQNKSLPTKREGGEK